VSSNALLREQMAELGIKPGSRKSGSDIVEEQMFIDQQLKNLSKEDLAKINAKL
jgi:hypothetical protein